MDDRQTLETLLLQKVQERKPELETMLKRMNEHWTYEDPVYRFYHHSFKVYGLQSETEDAVRLLESLLPGRPLNRDFSQIVAEGTGRVFDRSHNQAWGRHTRPIVEAFFHSKFMIEMAVRYFGLPEPPQILTSGWAAFLHLFDLR